MEKGSIKSKWLRLNILFSSGGQIIKLILTYLLRRVFIVYLGIECVGYNAVFISILQMLNLAELGIGIAITSFLYKPIAADNREEIKYLLYLYKRACTFIACAVFVLGVIVSTFIHVVVSDATVPAMYLKVFFLLHLIGAVASYYQAHRRALLIAGQRFYVTSIIETLLFIIATGVEIVLIICYRRYILFLLVEIIRIVISNTVIARMCNRRYPFIKELKTIQKNNELYTDIKRFIRDMLASRFGAYVFYSTDNVILSFFRGVIAVGIFSNYTMITAGINSVVNHVFSSLLASFGDYITTHQKTEQQRAIIDHYLCGFFLIGNCCMMCFIFLVQPFVVLAFGREYVLEGRVILVMAVNLLLTIMIQLPSQVFIVFRLYKYDKGIIAVSALLNIVVSVALVTRYGILGVLAGTLITSLIYLFSRLAIISTVLFGDNVFHYIELILKYCMISILSYFGIYFLIRYIPDGGWGVLVIRAVITAVTCIAIESVLLVPSKSFRFIIRKIIG